MTGECVCGHPFYEHATLMPEFIPGHPEGSPECLAEDCPCGEFRPIEVYH